MSDDKKYRECMSEIVGVLQKYDMAGAVTVISKERAMFRYQFPTWSVLQFDGNMVRFRAKRSDYPSVEAQHKAVELGCHIVLQMRDIAAQTFSMCDQLETMLRQKFDIEHVSFAGFDPERNN